VSRLTIGVDIGGTKVLAGAVDPDHPGELLASHRIDTPIGVEPLLGAITDVVGQVQVALVDGGHPRAEAVGVGVPALVDGDGVLVWATHLPGVTAVPVAELLGPRLGVPVVVDNDANCAVVGEARVGAGGGADDVVLVTLGTGIGGGILVGGALLRGAHGFAGEIGHVQVQRGGRPCQCGRLGCWEQYASGNALGATAREAARDGRLSAVLAEAGELAALRGEHVVVAAAAGDAEALAVLADFGWWVAAGIADLVNILDPAVVVLGGGLIAAGELLLRPVRTSYAALVIGATERVPVPIEAARLGPSAGAIGAALLAGDLVG
jgi:glucokinase